MEPSTKGPNGDGRDPATGRFRPGWRGGPGNPHVQQVANLRSALLGAVTAKDLKSIVTKLVKMAKTGNVVAAKEVLDRCLGRSRAELDVTQRSEVVKLYAPGAMEYVLGDRKIEPTDEV